MQVSGLGGAATQVSAGRDHTCARLSAGTLRCWGANASGQLGDGTTDEQPSSVAVVGLIGAEQVSAGAEHSCAVLGTGDVSCWGSRANGRLGDGLTVGVSLPVTVSIVGDANDISAGFASSCAATDAGTTYCWGNNADGQLGDGTTTERHTPEPVPGVPNCASNSDGDALTDCLDACPAELEGELSVPGSATDPCDQTNPTCIELGGQGVNCCMDGHWREVCQCRLPGEEVPCEPGTPVDAWSWGSGGVGGSGATEGTGMTPIFGTGGTGAGFGGTGGTGMMSGAGDAGMGFCGDGAINPGEQCDWPELGGATCETMGSSGGQLLCAAGCTYDTRMCL